MMAMFGGIPGLDLANTVVETSQQTAEEELVGDQNCVARVLFRIDPGNKLVDSKKEDLKTDDKTDVNAPDSGWALADVIGSSKLLEKTYYEQQKDEEMKEETLKKEKELEEAIRFHQQQQGREEPLNLQELLKKQQKQANASVDNVSTKFSAEEHCDEAPHQKIEIEVQTNNSTTIDDQTVRSTMINHENSQTSSCSVGDETAIVKESRNIENVDNDLKDGTVESQTVPQKSKLDQLVDEFAVKPVKETPAKIEEIPPKKETKISAEARRLLQLVRKKKELAKAKNESANAESNEKTPVKTKPTEGNTLEE